MESSFAIRKKPRLCKTRKAGRMQHQTTSTKAFSRDLEIEKGRVHGTAVPGTRRAMRLKLTSCHPPLSTRKQIRRTVIFERDERGRLLTWEMGLGCCTLICQSFHLHAKAGRVFLSHVTKKPACKEILIGWGMVLVPHFVTV